ncbi:MAG: MFS transporter [Bacteroidales bacterium]|nr:MFS transporter [Bacteroidales bacterium]MCI2145306.1 MFS transporter [Bacteroidales bacterium]
MRDIPGFRWLALILLAGGMFFAYMFVDVLSPLQSLLETEKGWSPANFGIFAGSEYFLNVFALFLIFAGIILDKMGVRFTIVLSGSVMVVGASIKYFAVSPAFVGTGLETWLNSWWTSMPGSCKLASLGFMIFGCGSEMAGITVSKGIVKWFEGKEMALAMGIEMAIARVGVAVVMLASPRLARVAPGVYSVARPVAFCFILLCVALIMFIGYAIMDKRLEKQMGEKGEAPEDPFKISDLGKLFSSKTFLLVSALCVLYYSAIFPFQKYAINMLQCNLHLTPEQASNIFFVFPLGAAAITPLLGNYLDNKGKGVSMLLLGAIMLVVCHLTFAFLPQIASGSELLGKIIAYAAIVLLGISFSLVPAALWPSVPKLVENRYLGSGYSVIFWIQNIGLWGFPILIGKALDATNKGVTDPTAMNYFVPMLIFASLGVLAFLLAVWLKKEDKSHNYGLELPNKEEALEKYYIEHPNQKHIVIATAQESENKK